MKCPHCGLSHPNDAKFCPVTGEKILDKPTESPKKRFPQKNIEAAQGDARFPLKIIVLVVSFILIIAGILMVAAGFITGDGLNLLGLNKKPNNGYVITSTELYEIDMNDETTSLVAELTLQPTEVIPSTEETSNESQVEPTPSKSPTPKPTTQPATSTPTEKSQSTIIDSMTNAKDGMTLLYVPEGEFLMGSNEDEDPYFWGAEGPAHEVNVDAFWIFQTEVTNEMYQKCVEEQACPKPLRNESRTVEDYYINPNYADYPVIQVNWVDAVSYCVWAGGRLPTEAEWEKAARGTDGRLFPWGSTNLQSGYASFCGSRCPGDEREGFDDDYYEIAPVGSFPAGASPYGALDLAGNVWEWVFDYFQSLYYQSSPYDNPLGPGSGNRRVIRGGSWFNPASGLRTVARTSLPPDDGLDTVGFRCVIDVNP